MNYTEIRKAVQRSLNKKDEIGIELEKKFDKRQKDYEQKLKDMKPTWEDMNTPMDF